MYIPSRKSLHSFAKPLILHRVRTYFTRSRCCVDIWLHEIRGPNAPTQSWLFKKRPGGFSAPANSPKEAATERLIAQFSPPPSYFPDLNFFMGANRTSDERKEEVRKKGFFITSRSRIGVTREKNLFPSSITVFETLSSRPLP